MTKDKHLCDVCELHDICIEHDNFECIYAKRCTAKNDDDKHTKPIGIFLALVLTLYGFILLLPYDTLVAHGYWYILRIANENTWGGICFAVGLIQFYSVFITKKKFIKVLSLSLQTFIWSFIGTMFLVNDIAFSDNTINTAFATYLCLAGLSLYTARRLR